MVENIIDLNFEKYEESDERSQKFLFYQRTIALLVVNNLINFGLFLFINKYIATFFSYSSLLFLYLYLVTPKDNLIKAKMAMNIAMLLQMTGLCLLMSGLNTVWFFLLPTIYTITMFPEEREKKWKAIFLSLAILSFIGWNFIENPYDYDLGAKDAAIARIFFRIDVFMYAFLSFMFWIDHSEKVRKKIKSERWAINAIMESIPLPIICKDVEDDFKIVFSNQAAKEYWGINSSNLVGLRDKELYRGVGKDELSYFNKLDIEASKTRKTLHVYGHSYKKSNGENKIINLTKVPLNKKYVVTIPEDITEMKNSLVEAETYKTALDQSAIVSFSDLGGNITFVNDKFCEVSGYSREELMHKNHRILKSGIHDSHLYSSMWENLKLGNIWRGEICNKSKSGKLYWVFSTIMPGFNTSGEIDKYISIRFDITKRKEAEERIIQGEKLATLGELSAGIFHEINNPLTVLKTKTTLLHKSIDNGDVDTQKLAKDIKVLEENIERIVRITKGLKSYSRNADHDPLVKENINEVVLDSLVLCMDKIRKGQVELIKNISDKEIYISCRKSEISQVVVNLINNAVDAIESNPEKWIKISSIIKNDKLELRITDSGKGIPTEVLNKMMTPFFTTKESGKGTGLGLSISLKIIKSHGGELVYDHESVNTCFVINLPLTDSIEMPKAS